MKKGFTLIEVIGTVIILGMIALLAFPQLLKLVKTTNKELSEASKTLVYTASSQYVNKYIDDYPKIDDSTYCITMRNLVSEGFLTKSIEDENLGDYGLDTKIQVDVIDDKYEYSINNDCIENN